MDVDAVLARKPQRALVDELAHTNVPGSRNEKRWQDVDELLDAGIDVISTVNMQHLESVNDVVERITGVKQQETIPDAIVRAAEPGRARRHDARGAPAAHGPRQHLPAREGRRLARQLLPPREPRRAPGARVAVGRRQGRRVAPGVPRDARHRPSVGDAGTRRRRDHGRARRRRRDPAGGAYGGARRTASSSVCTSGRPTGCAARQGSALDDHRRLLVRARRRVPRDRGRRHVRGPGAVRPRARTRRRSCSARAASRAGCT